MNIFHAIQTKIGNSNTRVLKGMGLVAAFLIVGKLLGAAKEMAIAYRFGTDQIVDVYVYAFVLISWIPVVAHSVFQSVLVPLLSRLENDDRKQFVGQLTGFTLFAGGLAMLFVLFVLPTLIPVIATGMSIEAQSNIHLSLLIMAPCVALLFIVALYSAELLSREKHANTLLEGLLPLAILICVLAWPKEVSVLPMLVGTLVGIFLQAVVLVFISKQSQSIAKVSLSFSNQAWPAFWKACSVLLVGALVLSIVRPFDQFLASSVGEGSVASLSYATRLLALGLVLGTTILSRAILPVLAGKDQTVISKTKLAKNWAFLVFFAGIFIGVIGWFLTPWAVSLLFERGAFTAQDTAEVAIIVRAGLIQMPFLFSGMVLVQLFVSLGDYKRIAISSFIGVTAKVIGGYIFVQYFGVAGIAMATGLMYVASFCFFYWSVKYRIAI